MESSHDGCRAGAAMSVPILLMIAAAPVSADVIHVPADQPTIQAGIDAAADGDEIVVADGRYSGPGNLDIDLRGKDVIVRSASRAPAACVIDCAGEGRGFIAQSGETRTTRIEGFRIINGFATLGGGILCTGGAAPTIIRCALATNVASFGGGLYCDLASPLVIDCRFESNAASASGAGLYNHGGSPEIIDCLFTDNTATFNGGGMRNAHSGHATLSGCVFIANNALDGGGLRVSSGTTTLSFCDFFVNHASSRGGGLAGAGVKLNHCTFISNIAGGAGGGYHCTAGAPVVADCVFQANIASNGGGLFAAPGAAPQVADSEFCGNEPNQVAGGWLDGGGNSFSVRCDGPCPGDLNADGTVGPADLAALLDQWGPCPQPPGKGDGGESACPADLNGDGVVGPADLAAMLDLWGPCG